MILVLLSLFFILLLLHPPLLLSLLLLTPTWRSSKEECTTPTLFYSPSATQETVKPWSTANSLEEWKCGKRNKYPGRLYTILYCESFNNTYSDVVGHSNPTISFLMSSSNSYSVIYAASKEEEAILTLHLSPPKLPSPDLHSADLLSPDLQ